MKLFTFFFLTVTVLLLSSCSNDSDQKNGDLANPTILSADVATVRDTSSEIGNFVTTAIKQANNLDFVFLPTAYFDSKSMVLEIKEGMSEIEIDAVLRNFPRDPQDQLLFGTMKGSKIKDFILQRARETYDKELEVAGMHYSLSFEGGFLGASNFLIEGRYDLDDDEFYRIGISDDFFFGSAFPGYRYRNNFNFNFRRERYQGSIRESIKKYLNMPNERFPYWSLKRAQVSNVDKGYLGFKSISQIQGPGHASPLRSHKVTTSGVVTAVGTAAWYPFGMDVYIQSLTPDNDDRTSEGLHVFVKSRNVLLQLGDVIRVTGPVIEDIRVGGLGQTSLRAEGDPYIISKANIIEEGDDSSSPTTLKSHARLPEAVKLGKGGRKIPTDRISTYSGIIMRKESLDLNDGIDFWESLEGMRVKMTDLKVIGFRGGGEDLIEISNRFYLNLAMVTSEITNPELTTHSGGLMIDFYKDDFNPEIITVTTNHLSKGIQVERDDNSGLEYFYYNVGDQTVGDTEGVITYQKNIFGGGEYAMVLPEPQKSFVYENLKTQGRVEVKDRGTTKLQAVGNEISFGSMNLENLPGNRFDRIEVIGNVFVENLACPDVINLVEIQDNNGISFRGTADATVTLAKLLGVVQSGCPDKNYEIINLNPFLQAEGGQPGGNIRVAMFFNRNKLSYEERVDGSIGSQALVRSDGTLSSNPGRIYPTDAVFRRSRRSVVVEFDVLSKPGEKIYAIGNHLNSKLGDISLWGNQQPARPNSDFSRSDKTAKINQYIQWIERENPKANIVVMGDFNALPEEESMQVLAGDADGDGFGEQLVNMIFTLPINKRYTTNFNGNSQGLDYIFANKNLFKKCAEAEILHINSDYMGRVSDHDPVVMKACF
jgi:hypothetical protein